MRHFVMNRRYLLFLCTLSSVSLIAACSSNRNIVPSLDLGPAAPAATASPPSAPALSATAVPTPEPTASPTASPTAVPTVPPTVPPVASGFTYPSGTPWAIPGGIDFDNYDSGGQGVGYNTSVSSNAGGAYRQDGVGIARAFNAAGGNGYYVGWNEVGDWYKYTIDVQTTATYSVAITVNSGLARGVTAGTFHIEDQSGQNLTGEIQVPGTGSWDSIWTTVNTTLPLNAGSDFLKVVIDSGAGQFNLDYMTLTAAGTSSLQRAHHA